MKSLLTRITTHPDVCHGKPVVRNMRYPVEMIIELLSAGMTSEEIIKDYPALKLPDIKACLHFASRLTSVKAIHKIVA